MDFLKDLSVYLSLLTVVGTPSFFLGKWTLMAYKNKWDGEFIVAASSAFLFISGWVLLTFAPAKYFKHDASESAMAIYKYFATCLFLSLFILFLYFLGWLASLDYKKWFTKKA